VPFAARAPQLGFAPACSHASHVTGGFLDLVSFCEVQMGPTGESGVEEGLLVAVGESSGFLPGHSHISLLNTSFLLSDLIFVRQN